MSKELWKAVKDYEGLYEVSNFGRVKSLEKTRAGGRYKCNMKYKERMLKPGKNAQGYLKLDLCKNGTVKTCRVNGLVLAAFIGESKLEGNHINGDEENNTPDNLEYVACSEKHKHTYKLGPASRKGERHHLAKLNNDIVKNIRENKFNLSLPEFAACYVVNKQTISNVIKYKSWQSI